MPVVLTKGGNVNLTKEAPGLTAITIGLGWKPRVTDGAAFDLDSLAFVLADTGKVRSDDDFIFFNHLKSADGSVTHNGDNLTGAGDEGDKETIDVNLAVLPAAVTRIVFAVNIFDGDKRNQTFGQVEKAYIRIIDRGTGKEIARYDLSEDASLVSALIFGEVYRNGADWKFKAVGEGYKDGFAPLVRSYGVNA